MDINRITSINRPLDPTYPTNRLIIGIIVIVLVVASLFHLSLSNTTIISIMYGITGGTSVFLVWAISREVDPDHDISAFVPVILSFIPVVVFGIHPVLPLLWLLLTLRIVDRSTGLKAGPFDTISVLLLSAFLTYQLTWIFGIITATAFFIDSKASSPNKMHLVASIIMLFISVFSIFKGNITAIEDITLIEITALLSMIILFIPSILDSRKLKSKGDMTGKSLDTLRVKMGKILLIITAILFVLTNVESAHLWPLLWCVATGIGLYRILIGDKTVKL
ncbi:hypothetical protein LI82_00935 [Methanococcoides methylutens]|uniref:Uncharacterized protein n=1 Tax=Methanococcoides methylutens TaxID=2226 RepID=A0A099T3Y0_METMT|nr:hypothetical protein [Methanococcoides methylutens]KGK99797.1 hypothetical protein LI82_00935 [Methanococcoides methylutens]